MNLQNVNLLLKVINRASATGIEEAEEIIAARNALIQEMQESPARDAERAQLIEANQSLAAERDSLAGRAAELERGDEAEH